MKRIALAAPAVCTALAVLTLLSACTRSLPAVVDDPYVSFKNSTSLHITRMEKTDTATVMWVDAEYYPHMWIKVVPESKLVADGVDYALKGAEGMTPGEEFYMPDSGKASFKLFFESVPAETKQVDFYEGDSPRGFHILDIDLTGRGPKEPKPTKRKTVPQPQMTSGQTTVILDYAFLKGRQSPVVSAYVEDFFPGGYQEFSGKPDEQGKVVFSFWQNGPGMFSCSSMSANIPLCPGETVTIHPEGACEKRRPFVEGVYGDVVMPIETLNGYRFSVQPEAENQTASEYMQLLRETYLQKCQDVELEAQCGALSPFEKDYLDLFLKQVAWRQVCFADAIRRSEYARSHGNSRQDYVPMEFSDEDLAWLKELNLEDERLLLIEPYIAMGHAGLIDRVMEGKDNYLTEFVAARPLVKQAEKGLAFTPEEQALVDGLKTPLFKTALEKIYAEAVEVLASQPENVKETPDVPAAQTLKALIANYPGEVMLIDIWATWCGPCRHAHMVLEPLKDGKLKEVRFVYLTGPTSPREKWLKMVPDISGDHYYLSEEQLETILKQAESNGFPTYLLIDRKGEVSFKSVGYNPTIPEKLEELL